MSEFIRARCSERKDVRMAEIKAAAETLFANKPYQEITLTTIAQELSWSRANLYKYVCTKEEIFLELCADKRMEYFNALKAAFPRGCGYSMEVYAEVWACILNAHKDFLRYSDILCSILETNVSIEKLAEFKKGYFQDLQELLVLMQEDLSMSQEDVYELVMTVHYHAVGLNSGCCDHPVIRQAMEYAQIPILNVDFREEMKKFIYKNLHYPFLLGMADNSV